MNLLNKRYIVKESSGREWYFFFREKSGICYANLINKRLPSFDILFSEGMGDFDVIVDINDSLHLICQDKRGNIVYLVSRNDKWLKYVILESKSQNHYPKHFKILLVNDSINLFYVIDHNEDKLFVHQILSSSNQPPEVVGVISESAFPFYVTHDGDGDIYAYYMNTAAENRIGYCKYLSSKKVWLEFSALEELAYSPQPPYVMFSSDNVIHAVYIKKADKGFNIIYNSNLDKYLDINSHINSDNVKSASEVIIASILDLDFPPVIILTSNRLWLVWSNNHNVFSCFSEDNGISWNNPSQFMSGRNSNVELFGYRTNKREEALSIFADLCYGYTGGSNINLYILPSYIEKLKHPQPKNVIKAASTTGDAVARLKLEITSLREELLNMNKKIDALSNQISKL